MSSTVATQIPAGDTTAAWPRTEALREPTGRAPAAAAAVEVFVWGPAGAGKTVLLASLCRMLDEYGHAPGRDASAGVRAACGRLAEWSTAPTPTPDPAADGEHLTFHAEAADGVASPVRVSVHAGDGLDALLNDEGGRRRMTVLCLNPFLVDEQIAWNGLRDLLAVLQRPGVGLPLADAVETAAGLLLQVEPQVLRQRPELSDLLSGSVPPRSGGSRGPAAAAGPAMSTEYAADAGLLADLAIDAGGDDRPTDVDGAVARVLHDLVLDRVRAAAPAVGAARRVLASVADPIVVLTRVDLIDALLPSVTSDDLERVFDYLYDGRPGRRVGQQVAARPFRLVVPGLRGGDPRVCDPAGLAAGYAGDAGATIDGGPAAGPIVSRLRPDGAGRLLDYLHEVAATAGRRVAAPVEPDPVPSTARPGGQPGGVRDTPDPPPTPADRAAYGPGPADAVRGAAGPGPTDETTDAWVAERVAAERARGERRLAELKHLAQQAIAARDAALDQLRRQLRAGEAAVARATAKDAGWAGGLPAEERAARDRYETSRLGGAQVWALLLLRSLPVMPVVAVMAFLALRAGMPPAAGVVAGEGDAGAAAPWWAPGDGNARAFLVASGVSLLAYAGAAFFGVGHLWRRLGPRWIWLRRLNTRTRRLEVLTSGGEALEAPADAFTLLRSPVLSALGLGVVRRNDTGQTYVASDPAAWLGAPERPQVRWRLGFDLLTLGALAAWVAAIVWLVRGPTG